MRVRLSATHAHTHAGAKPSARVLAVRAYDASASSTAALLSAEKPNGRLRTEPRDRSQIDADRDKLAKDGFAAIVLNRAHFRDAHRYDAVRALLVPLGAPKVIGTEEIFVLSTP